MVRERLIRGLHDLDEQVLGMAEHARAMLNDSLQALDGLDRALAEDVAARTERLAEMDEAIEHGILRFMALETPVAGDLRRVGAALKIITYINRLGRYGFDIAKVVKGWPEDKGHMVHMVGLKDLGDKVGRMLDAALDAYRGHKAPDTKTVLALEEEVDALRSILFRDCLTHMMEDPRTIERGTQYVMVARYLERCGDNVCKMVEKLHYAATGERILLS